MTELQNNLPAGWDSKIDSKTGKTYYINHYLKTTTWDDPRQKYRIPLTTMHNQHSTSEYIPLQHGTPDLRRNYIYPSQPPPKPAFQMSGQYSPKYIPLQDMRSVSRTSPLLLRTSQTQESSLTSVPDTDESVAKISSMFPTVSDTHIRLLLKKYHSREAVVISALQVEKHPITTPGPFATPPPARNIFPGIHPSLQMTPPLGVRTYTRGGSPITRFGSISTTADSPRVGDNYRNSHRPHSSPKLKLRYMKSIFPKAEETIILDVLSCNENNIQKASDYLKGMGYERRDPVKLLQQQQAEAKLEEERLKQEVNRIEIPLVLPIKTTEQKVAVKERLHEQYKDINQQVIVLALESVQYDEARANQVLQIMIQEDSRPSTSNSNDDKKSNKVDGKTEELKALTPNSMPVSQSRQSFKSLLISEKTEINNKDKCNNFCRVVEESDKHYNSSLSNTQGANSELVKGANEKLLLVDYVTWQGPNMEFSNGPQRSLAKGPSKANLSTNIYRAHGPNSDLCKGSKSGLAKGSIFKQFRRIAVGESRGK